MGNKYLEKVATTALKNHFASKGIDVSGISNNSLATALPAGHGSFGKMDAVANRLNKGLGAAMPMPKKPGMWDKAFKPIRTYSEGAQSLRQSLTTSQTPLRQALQSHVGAKAVATEAASKGFAGKALSLVKKHPIAAAATAAGAAGLAIGKLSSGNSNNSAQYY